MKTSKWLVGIPTLVCAMLFVSNAFATVVPVVDPSFETLPSGGLPANCGPSCQFDQGVAPQGWMFTPGTTNPGFFGQLQPGSGPAGSPPLPRYFNYVPDGITVAWSDEAGSIISQQIAGQTVNLGDTYTLTVYIGARGDIGGNGFNGGADLVLGSTMCAAAGLQPSPGNWSLYTATCSTTNPLDANQPIIIQLNDTGTTLLGAQADFDNVQLTDSLNTAATPEPASFFLMGSGLLAMGGILRRRIFGR
jgi:PEP-CTERM motif